MACRASMRNTVFKVREEMQVLPSDIADISAIKSREQLIFERKLVIE